MISAVRRIYVEKKEGFNVEAENIYNDLRDNYKINNLEKISIINRYDIEGVNEKEYIKSKKYIFSEANVDNMYDEKYDFNKFDFVFAVGFLPGQFDQRADSACQGIKLLTGKEDIDVEYAKIVGIDGELDIVELKKIKEYFINPVESEEVSFEKKQTLKMKVDEPKEVAIIDGFINLDKQGLEKIKESLGLAMSMADIQFCQNYFKNEEKRDPTITEIRVVDTYWSDHCRHTTFLTKIKDVKFEAGKLNNLIKKSFEKYLNTRERIYKNKKKNLTLMDVATIAVKELRSEGYLTDLDISEEINACSINIDVEIDGNIEKWLLMFKNETHNHPTEIEPYGGAATCLGGAIRDPLSGRAYVYQAMRVTGCANPLEPIENTLEGKLPQRKITQEATRGYSSYGNQIGLATGQVKEIYDEGYKAKRMEIGAVIGATPKKNVVRERPETNDVVILLGGKTGRDGCGGATGSSKEHTDESLITCGAEVQKGNPPTERKLQRLFRKEEVSTLIKRCNDFGAGGVCVAVGELTEGLDIELDNVPKKYEGLDGTELAISESQERMAVVVSADNKEKLFKEAQKENVEATVIAKVTDKKRMNMYWKNQKIVSLKRSFLDSNGAETETNVKFINNDINFDFSVIGHIDKKNTKKSYIQYMSDLNICSQKGMVEQFDSTIGASTILMPYGGKYQLTEEQGMAALIPALGKETKTASLMAFGYNPKIFGYSPYIGAMHSVVESVSKIVAMGGNYKKTRLTFQEYFEKLGDDSEKWSKPLGALLGAYEAQLELSIAAIGGKDSMSGTFNDLDVPPTLVSFAVNSVSSENVISSEMKKTDSNVLLLETPVNELGVFDYEKLRNNFDYIQNLIKNKKVLSVRAIGNGGIIESITKMCFGNKIGFEFSKDIEEKKLTNAMCGSFIVEVEKNIKMDGTQLIGCTNDESSIKLYNENIELDEILENWENKLESVFPTRKKNSAKVQDLSFKTKNKIKSKYKYAKPRVFIPVFPGTNCEYDSMKAFKQSGGIVKCEVFRNLNSADIDESVEMFRKNIEQTQIIMIPGGFSAGDEPEGSGKFITTVFRNEKLKSAIEEFLYNRDGLMIGICNGFQALIKLGLVPFGRIQELTEDSPTLTFNKIGRHVSQMVKTKIVSDKSPWLSKFKTGEIIDVPVSHGEGRFYATDKIVKKLIDNGQIATQYVDLQGNATNDIRYNPNGSVYAVEGVTSADGRVFGKMGHSERLSRDTYKNISTNSDFRIFESGIEYFG